MIITKLYKSLPIILFLGLTSCVSTNELAVQYMKNDPKTSVFLTPECEKKWTQECTDNMTREMKEVDYAQLVKTYKLYKGSLELRVTESGRIKLVGFNPNIKTHISKYNYREFSEHLKSAINFHEKFTKNPVKSEINKKFGHYISYSTDENGKNPVLFLSFTNDSYTKIIDLYSDMLTIDQANQMISHLNDVSAQINAAKQARKVASEN